MRAPDTDSGFTGVTTFYETVKHDFAPAANNLAWNLAQRGGSIDEALRLARIAKEQPDMAREFLGKALQLDGRSNGAEEARRILKEIEASSDS